MQAVRMLVGAVMLAAVLPFGLSSTAAADPPSCPTGETPSEIPGGWICIPVQNPGDPDTEDPGNGTPGGGEPTQCQDGDKVVPCTDEHGGTWDAGHGCYGFRLDPQPPANSPLWRGHDPSEGSIWSCDHTVSVLENTWFVANGAQPLVDPAVLAQTALGRMKLERANAEIAPGPDFHTYVHIDNWLWVPADQWRALRETVSAGPTSVTVTAAPARVEWDLGPETKICYDAGRAWVKGMTDAAKTTCSHAYEAIDNPIGDTHDVSAQIVYGATWTCSGACVSPSGDLGEITAPSGETTTIEVRQRQTVVTN